jgi:hypothetical protein
MTTSSERIAHTTAQAGHHGNRATRLLNRTLPLAGVVFAVLSLAGNLVIGPFPGSDTPITRLLGFYATHHAQVHRGGLLLGYATIFFAVFGVAMWSRVNRSAAPKVLAAAVLVGTAIAGFAMIDGADTYATLGDVGNLPTTAPAARQAWHIGGSIGGTGADSIILLLPLAAAGILAKAMPRWLAWSALALAVMHLTPFGFLAYLLFHLWAVLAGITLTVRPSADALTANE